MNQDQQHPTAIVCSHCETSLRRTGEVLPGGRVYTCFCGGTTRIVPVKIIRRIPVQRGGWPPNNAA